MSASCSGGVLPRPEKDEQAQSQAEADAENAHEKIGVDAGLDPGRRDQHPEEIRVPFDPLPRIENKTFSLGEVAGVPERDVGVLLDAIAERELEGQQTDQHESNEEEFLTLVQDHMRLFEWMVRFLQP